MDKNLLNDRFNRLKEWENRASLNDILYDTLSGLANYADERFDALTREIADESRAFGTQPVVRIAVCSDENLDKQRILRPVSGQTPASGQTPVSAGARPGDTGCLATIFVESDYYTIREMMRRTYAATIRFKTGAVGTRVSLRYSVKYKRRFASLYYAFVENELPWSTLNEIYNCKFLDVCCDQIDGRAVEGFEIDFTRYSDFVSYDKSLFWNISPSSEPVESRECDARPAYNAVQFEHALKNLPLDDAWYLIANAGDKFSALRRGQILYVRTYAKKLERIELLKITDGGDEDGPLHLPPASNKKKSGYIDAMAKGRRAFTAGEAERTVRAMIDESEMRLIDINVLPCSDENVFKYGGIGFNDFIEANAFLRDKKLLLFRFKSGIGKLWAHETMFYVLSELQLQFFEYRCVGEIV
jgi:hypothetical protein